MGLITGGSFAAATGERRLKGDRYHALAESTSAPLPKRQRVAGSTDHNTDTEVSQSSSSESMSSESMVGVEFAQTLPNEDEILTQVSVVHLNILWRSEPESHIFTCFPSYYIFLTILSYSLSITDDSTEWSSVLRPSRRILPVFRHSSFAHATIGFDAAVGPTR
jgi:hypothetical protein